MKYLLDTHVLVWLLVSPEKLSPSVKQLLSEEDSEIFGSVLNLWEIATKNKKNKIPISAGMTKSEADRLGLEMIAVNTHHIASYENLEIKHKDPFDLMLIAQAECNGLSLITADQTILKEYSNSINAC